jgi:hypothetical protein
LIWQDLVISITVLVFALTIIPMVRAKVKLPLLTTIPMVVGAIALTIAYISLGLWVSVGVEVVSALLWGVLLRRSFA